VEVMALLLILEVKFNFSLGFDNTDYQTNKLQNVHALHCTLVLIIVPEGSELSQLETHQRKRTSQESKMVTYKHVTEVVRNRCVNHQAKRMVSRAIVLLNATSVGALIIWIIKQTNTNTANQTNKLNK